ncbi:MAG: hypothetical protein WC389_08025 [Lutibacter sp.]|jgi:hypothetical protein
MKKDRKPRTSPIKAIFGLNYREMAAIGGGTLQAYQKIYKLYGEAGLRKELVRMGIIESEVK